MTAANYGAAQYERCKKVLKLCLAGGITGTVVVTYYLFCRRRLFMTIRDTGILSLNSGVEDTRSLDSIV